MNLDVQQSEAELMFVYGNYYFCVVAFCNCEVYSSTPIKTTSN
jgi:hypothetical protein